MPLWLRVGIRYTLSNVTCFLAPLLVLRVIRIFPLAVILLHTVPSARMTDTEFGSKLRSKEVKYDLSLKIWADAPESMSILWLEFLHRATEIPI